MLQLSLNDYVNDLERILPKEPNVDDSNSCSIEFIGDGDNYSRRFNKNNTINVNSLTKRRISKIISR